MLRGDDDIIRETEPDRVREREREREGGISAEVGVTNQRLAIVNSTCAVKQLINKRLFTSYARVNRKCSQCVT